MQKEFSINIVFLLGINLLIKPFFIFGIDRTVQNIVGTEIYGNYFALLNFAYLFQIINDLGLQYFNTREISQNNQLLSKYFPNMIVIKLILAILFLTVTLLTAYFLGYQLSSITILLYILINQVLVSLILYLRSNISGLGKYRIDSLLSATDKLLMILFCSILLWTPYFRSVFQIEHFIFAQTASLALTALIAYLIIRKEITKTKINFNLPRLILILKKSFPFALAILIMTIYTRVDAVMIERLLQDGNYQAGLYGAAYRLLDASNMIGFLFASLLLPMFSKLLKTKTDILNLVHSSFSMILAGAIPLAITTFYYRTEIMNFLYVEATTNWGEVLGYLILSFIAVSGTYVYGTLLSANNNLKQLNVLFIVSLILNVILNLILIPSYKASGAAIATLITQFVVLIGEIILAHKILNIKINLGLYFKLLVFVIGTIVLNNLISQYLKEMWTYKYVLTMVLTAILPFLLDLLNIKLLLQNIRGK